MGRVSKGQKCSVSGCKNDAVRSLPLDKAKQAGLRVGEGRRAYLCREHYREFKRATKKDRTLEKWRYGVAGRT